MRCRHDAWVAAQLRRKRLMLRGGAVALVVATFLAAGLSATAMRGKATGRRAGAPADSAVVDTTAPVGATQAPTVSTSATRHDTTTVPPPTAAPVPMVPPGESPLLNGFTAVRADSVVTVVFDIPNLRTRNPAKFEQVVRTTLPEIYGPAAQAALAKIPDGGIASQGALLTELPTRGVRIPLAGNAGVIRVYPETRQGQDGPIVVRYRVSIVAASSS